MAKKKGSALNIVEGIFIAILIILIGGMLFLYFSFSETGAAPNIFGYTIYHTKAVSMQPEIPSGAAVIAKASEIDSIKTGSVVLCKIGEDTVLTRVVQLVNEEGVMSYVVKFDTARAEDTFKIPGENIIAKAIWTSKGLGAVLNFATSTFGIMLVVIIPSFLIIVLQIIRIINVKRSEEEALSLDDLDEIMISNDDDDAEDSFREPELERVPVRTEEPVRTEQAFRFDDNDKKEDLIERLNVDKNGKAGLKFTSTDNVPLFTYDNLNAGRKEPAPKAQRADEKDGKYSNYGAPAQAAPAAAETPKNDEPVSRMESGGMAPFMSNVLPEKLANTVSESEKPGTEKVPTPVTVKPVREDRAIRSSKAIPPKAALPKEKLAPPRKSTGKTISDLMSMIDAEESKLK